MSFFGKPQIIKMEQRLLNKGTASENEVLFVRLSSVVESKNAILEVPYTHTAMLIKSGVSRHYGPGNHSIFENKKEIKDWKKGFSLEVIYMPKETRVEVSWGTKTPILYRDPDSKSIMKLGARGNAKLNITNPEQFFRRAVGMKEEYTLRDFNQFFAGLLVDRFVSSFLPIANSMKLMYSEFESAKRAVANEMAKDMQDDFLNNWGVSMEYFIIEEISADEEGINAVESYVGYSMAKEEAKELKQEAERLDDKMWERQKYLRQQDSQDKLVMESYSPNKEIYGMGEQENELAAQWEEEEGLDFEMGFVPQEADETAIELSVKETNK